MATWHLGTMGFGYRDWAGVFYPTGLKSDRYLAHYATQFDAVELDTTFYATPSVQRVRKWADMVPQGFRFAAKTPRDITHTGQVGQMGDAMRQFVDVMRHMEGKLGVILLQFPPSFGAAQYGELATLLAALPEDVPFAVELRNRTWGQSPVLELLRQHRVALALADYTSRPAHLHVTSDLLYVRWVGLQDRFTRYDHEQLDPVAALRWWHEQLCQVEPQVQRIWGFFNNNFAGYAPATCQRFRQMVLAENPRAFEV